MKMFRSFQSHSAFSLVELSIVLVILGLLTGGILAGQSLIRASELRSVSVDLQRFVGATHTFRDKYFALPGDMSNATQFWGTDNLGCPNGGGTTGTCNGNADGNIGSPTSVGNICEVQEYWRQLSSAGLIEGSYKTNATASCFATSVPGVDSAKLRLGNSGVVISALQTITSNAVFPGNLGYIGSYGNTFFVGRPGSNGLDINSFIKPEEQWNIDTKMDDGKPASGNIRSIYPGVYGPAAGATGCVTTNVAATAEYSLANTSIACAILYIPGI